MPFQQMQDREQIVLKSLDSEVKPDSIARVIDAFVDSLNLEDYGFRRTEAAKEGRPSYDPKALLKLLFYGNKEQIRSSRKLAKACEVNIEVRWLMGGLTPDFRTISDFRKDNIGCMKNVFHELNRRIETAVETGYKSVDGSKFQAQNSKDSNFTKNKLDDRIKWLNEHTDDYLRQLAELDALEDGDEIPGTLTREELNRKLSEVQERLAKYLGYRKYMEDNGLSQLSLSDADSKLMKNKNGFCVGYNVQTAVDSETHMIDDYLVTNHPTDHGLMAPTMKDIKDNTDGIVDVVADKGYNQSEDMIKCLENGIRPHVIPNDGQDSYELELDYEESECDPSSASPEELKKTLHNGQIPDAYRDVIESIEVKEVRRKQESDTPDEKSKIRSPYGTEEGMIARAKEGYFVRDPEANVVYCPMGEMLRQKSIKNNGNIRYSNKSACRHCPNRNKCYKGKNEWKEVDFTKDTLEKPCKGWLEAEGKTSDIKDEKKPKAKYIRKMIVRLILRPDRKMMGNRMCLSEHPFGTIKRALGATYFLMNGMAKVDGEFALIASSYNLTRGLGMLGFDKMMELMAGA